MQNFLSLISTYLRRMHVSVIVLFLRSRTCLFNVSSHYPSDARRVRSSRKNFLFWQETTIFMCGMRWVNEIPMRDVIDVYMTLSDKRCKNMPVAKVKATTCPVGEATTSYLWNRHAKVNFFSVHVKHTQTWMSTFYNFLIMPYDILSWKNLNRLELV